MRYTALLLVGLALASCDRDSDDTRSYELRYIPAEAALGALQRPESNLGPDVRVMMKPNSAVVTLYGEAEQLDHAMELLRDIDRPQPVVRIRIQLVEADGFPAADSAIADVEAVLRDIFRFRGYRLAAEAVAHGEAPGHIRQLIGVLDEAPVMVNVDVTRVVAGDSAAAVSMNVDLALGNTSILSTSLTVPAGKTAVVGSARASSERGTLILVVRPEIQ